LACNCDEAGTAEGLPEQKEPVRQDAALQEGVELGWTTQATAWVR
jgi:hypothetical protein